MKLLICVITHNRLAYTKRCLRALDVALSAASDGVLEDYSVVVVDNASTDGTVEWLKEKFEHGPPAGNPEWLDGEGDFGGAGLYDRLITNKANRFPGAACNQGWMVGMSTFQATHLMRLDNDCVLDESAFLAIEHIFDSFDGLGQLGIIEMSEAKEFPYVERVNEETKARLNTGPTNIGGPCVILREAWDKGLRYSEMPWQNFGGPTPQEDVKLSLDLKEMGYFFGNVCEEICTELSFGNTDDYFDYYAHTFQLRGHGVPARTKEGDVIEAGSHGERDHI